jgi:hypothetical protein
MTLKYAAVLLMALAGCVPEDGTDPGTVQPGDLLGDDPGTTLVEREPDLCHAADYQVYLGQPGTVVPTLGITRTYRVIAYGQIFTQEYNAGRLNFRLTPDGTITKVDCG